MGNERATLFDGQADFRGGINTNVPKFMVLGNQLVTAEDCIVWRGGIKRTSGYSTVLTTVPAQSRGLGLFRFYDSPCGTQRVFKLSNGKVYRVSGTQAAAIGSGHHTGNKMQFAVAGRKLYVTDGQLNLRGWSGVKANAIFTPSAVPPEVPKYCFFHQDSNRLFVGNGATTPNRVWYSDVNAFETWPANNFFDIPESRTGESVTGFARLLGRLVVFGERTISVLYGRTPSDYQLRTVDWSRGCPYPYSIVGFDEYVVFMSNDGIYKFDGSGPADKVNWNINEDFYAVTLNLSNPGEAGAGGRSGSDYLGSQLAHGPTAYADREGNYVLSYIGTTVVGAATVNNDREIVIGRPMPEAPYWRVLAINKRGFSYYNRNTPVGSTGGIADQTFAQIGSGNGNIFELERSQFYNTAGIDMVVETKQYDCGNPFMRKEFLGIEVHCEAVFGSHSLRVQYKIDNESNWREAGNVLLGRNGPVYGDKDMTRDTGRNLVVHPILLDSNENRVGNFIQLRLRQQGITGTPMPCTIRMVRISAREWKDI